MERAGIAGDLLSWRDVLHEGPVPDLPPDELRAVRAQYLATLGEGDAATVEADLLARDERLAAALAEGEPVVLWFEHDLYDQLQLIQILAGLPDRPEHVELICVGSFPGRPGFAGLGELEPDELASLWPVRTPVIPEHVRARARGVGRRARRRPARARARGGHARRAPALPRARPAAAARGAARHPRRPRPHASASCSRRWRPARARASRRSWRAWPRRRRRSWATRSRSTGSRASTGSSTAGLPRAHRGRAAPCSPAAPTASRCSASTAGSAACTSAPRTLWRWDRERGAPTR